MLLRRFTDAEGWLWIYDLERGAIHRGDPRSVAFERDLYSTTKRDGTTDYALVEEMISKYIDGPGDQAIRRILRREKLGEDWHDFLRFVAAQLLRTPTFFDRSLAMMQPIMQEMLERMANYEPKFREPVRKRLLASGMADTEIEAILKSVGQGNYKIKPSREMVLIQAISQIENIHSELLKMKWQIATLEPSEPDLILGDHPALPVVPKGEHVGLCNQNIDLMLPLTRRIAAVGNWYGEIAYGISILGTAERINRETTRHAKRFLFASSYSEELLKTAITLHGTGPQLHTTRKYMDGKLVIMNEYR